VNFEQTVEKLFKSNPYRLYNVDNYQYELNSRQALYGAVPFMLSLNELGSIGLYWANAAETWIDIFKHGKNRTVTWTSETGLFDFFVLPGRTPKEIMRRWADLSGHGQLPQYFSLGYH